MRAPAWLRALRYDRRAITVVEFAMVAPVMCIFLVGAFDVGHTLYMKAVLEGALQKAARDTALESGNSPAQQAAIDTMVKGQVAMLNNRLNEPGAVTITRRFYRTFTAAGEKKPETLFDTNGNGLCDNGEKFDDVNANGERDADSGDDGQGGAKDSVLYTVSLIYDRIMPLPPLGLPAQVTLTSSTILKNQPYADQGAALEGKCPK